MAAIPGRGVGGGGGAAQRGLAGTGLLKLVPDPDSLAKVARDAQGRFRDMQKAATLAHQEMAIKAAATISDYLHDKVAANGRQQRAFSDSESLVALIKAPGNLDYNGAGFIVGKEGFLESSAARAYFRNLETGTRIFVGRELRGFFVSAQGRSSPPSADRFKKDPRLIQVNKFFAGTKGARDALKAQAKANEFHPELQTYGRTLKKLPKPTQDAKGRTPGGFKIVIRNPIPAYEYFLMGGLRYTGSSHIRDTYIKHGILPP